MHSLTRITATASALALGLGLSACGDTPNNSSLYSVKQPVVESSNFTLDLASSAGGLTVPEQARLGDWFDTIGIKYGDRIGIDDPMNSPAVREDVAAVASRYGLLVSEGAPVTVGYVDPGNVRVVVTRTTAHVPGCPDWSDHGASTMGNYTSDGFGCGVNSNMAAMIANPRHLLEGEAGTGETVVMSSTKAIQTYRDAQPTGAGGLAAESTEGN